MRGVIEWTGGAIFGAAIVGISTHFFGVVGYIALFLPIAGFLAGYYAGSRGMVK